MRTKNELEGAEFRYAEYDVKTHGLTSAWTDMDENGKGYFTLFLTLTKIQFI